MKPFKHAIENPFVTGAGIAALTHSTWALGTLFSGEMPIIVWDNPTSVAMWLYWFVPAFLIGVALDIGQIDTSHKIRHEGLTWQRAVTFFVFAIATYYLQFLYIAHHMPALAVQDGVSDFHLNAVRELRNAAIWVLPAFLPLATLLYTLSGHEVKAPTKNGEQTNEQDFSIQEHGIAVVGINTDLADWIVDPENLYDAQCPDCGKEFTGYKSEHAAASAVRAHQRHCELVVVDELVKS